MPKYLIGLAATVLISLTPVVSQAQLTLGPTVAYHDDFDIGIGATVGALIPSFGPGIGFMGDFLYFFPDGGVDYFELNGNVTYDFPLPESTVVPFVLAGLNVASSSRDVPGGGEVDDTEVGLNLGGGLAFDAGSFRPTVGGRFQLDGGEGFVFFATLPFKLGR